MKRKKIFITIIIIVIIVAILLLLTLKNKSNKNLLAGSWISQGGTIYEFKENNEGVMIVPLSNYKFKYEIKGKKLSIDYEDKKANDTDYEYSFENDKLILKGERGTFTFTRK